MERWHDLRLLASIDAYVSATEGMLDIVHGMPTDIALNTGLTKGRTGKAVPKKLSSSDTKQLTNRKLEQKHDSISPIEVHETRIVALRHHPAVWFVPAVLLVFALVPLPYGFYMLLRLIVCAVSVWLAYEQWKQDDAISAWVVVLIFIALVYNPIISIHLTREIWSMINLVTSSVFIGHLWFLKRLINRG